MFFYSYMNVVKLQQSDNSTKKQKCRIIITNPLSSNNIIPWVVKASPTAQLLKNSPAMQETPVWFLDREDPLGKG